MDFFTSNNYDYIIVGGGISGLFLALKLSDIPNFKVLLIEKNSGLGGRIHTYETKKYNMKWEAGAARFNKKHTKLISLIKELGLSEHISELPLTCDAVLRNNSFEYPYYLKDDKMDLDFNTLLEKVLNESSKYSKAHLINITFFQLCTNIIGFEGATFLKDIFGYSAEFLKGNADSMINIFKNNFADEEGYYILKGGLSQIILKIHNVLKSRDNVTIKLNTNIREININTNDNYYVKTNDNKSYYAKNIILTIYKKGLIEFDLFKSKPIILKWLNSVEEIPLCRIYAIYDKCWYNGINKTTTDNNIRYFIPMNYNENNCLAMISYSDSSVAEGWHNIYKVSRDLLLENVHNNLKEIFPNTEISKVLEYKLHYWGNGLHLWKPGANSDVLYKHILKPFTDKNLFIGGEAYSKNQGWIEGSLETCYDILNSLDMGTDYKVQSIRKIEIREDYDLEEEDYSEDDSEDVKEVKDSGKVKLLNIDFLKEEMNKKNPRVIVMDFSKITNIDGFKDNNTYIFSIDKWFGEHPGGNSNLEKGIKANNYYLDKGYKGKSPIELFISISNHHRNMLGLLKTHFINDHSYVKKLGILKL